MPLHFLSKGIIFSLMSCHLYNVTQAGSADMQWMEFLWCRMVLYTHSEGWNLLAWTNLLKKMKRCCFLRRALTKVHHWRGQDSVSVCTERLPLPPHYEIRKRFHSHPKKGIFCISANQNKVCSVFLWPVMEIFLSKHSIPFHSMRNLSSRTEEWVAVIVVVRFKCKGQIVRIKIVT